MLVKVKLNIARMFALITAFLAQYLEEINKIDFNTEYGTLAVLETDNFQITLGVEPLTFNEAQKYCLYEHASLLTVESELNLGSIFDKVGKNSLWTGLYRMTKNSILVDPNHKTPILGTIHGESISASTLNMEEALHKGITIDRTDLGFSYLTVDKMETRPVVCIKRRDFPYKKIDRSDLGKVKTAMLDLVKQKSSTVERLRHIATQKEKLMIDLKNSSSKIVFQQTVNLEAKIENILSTSLKESKETIVNGFQNLKTETSLAFLVISQASMLTLIDNLLLEVMSPLDSPLSLLSDSLAQDLEEIRKPVIKWYKQELVVKDGVSEDIIYIAISQTFLEKINMPVAAPEIIQGFFQFDKTFIISMVDVVLFSIDLVMISGFCCACAQKAYGKRPEFLKKRTQKARTRVNKIRTVNAYEYDEEGLGLRRMEVDRINSRARNIERNSRGYARAQVHCEKSYEKPIRKNSLPLYMMDSDLSIN